jgi:pyruvate,orthophosphate dikinase
MGKVCLVGCAALRVDEKTRTVAIGSRTLREGDTICLDAELGRVLDGQPELRVERPTALLAEVAKWRRRKGS